MNNKFKSLLCFILALVFCCCLMPTSFSAIDEPEISHSTASLIYCNEPDKVLWSENAELSVYPAALTKLMTVVVAAEGISEGKFKEDQYITASSSAIKATMGNSISIAVGEKLKLKDLIGATILAGANDAALIIAETLGGSVDGFVSLMNEKAKELGMKNTVYTNPTGLHNDKMVTTAEDLLILAKHASRIQFLTELFSTTRLVIDATNKSETRYLGTRNFLQSNRVSTDYYYPGANGMICGSTSEAGFCIIATAQHDGLNYIAIVLGAGSTTVITRPEYEIVDEEGNTTVVPAEYKTIIHSFVEAATLLKWAKDNYEYIKAIDSSTPICQIPVRLAESVDNVVLLPETPVELYVPVDINKKKDIEISWELESEYLTAPVSAGEKVGTVTVKYEGEIIGQVGLVVKTNIQQSGALVLLNRVEQLASSPFFLVIIIAISLGAIIYIFATAVSRSRKKAAARLEFIKKNRYIGNGK